MLSRPKRRLKNWIRGLTHGEISASGLDGLREVGASAYGLAEEVEELRSLPDWDGWRQDRSTQLFLVCAWNAYALQTISDHLLGSDGDTPSVFPEEIVAFVYACGAQVPTWVEGARLAKANPAYRTSSALPASLPAWPQFHETRRQHLNALRTAYEQIDPPAEYELARLVKTATAADQAELDEITVVAAQMRLAFEAAERLGSHTQSERQRREVRDRLVEALGNAYLLGQITAMPSLIERLRLAGYRANRSAPVPPAAIGVGWTVIDRTGTTIGTVSQVEGEPRLGTVTALVIAVDALSPDRRAHAEQIARVEPGVVRLSLAKAELERA